MEIVEAAIDRLCAADAGIHCVAAERFESARAEARQIDSALAMAKSDQILANGLLSCLPHGPSLDSPFLGVPMTIKECLAVR